jgi:anti-anti-sigma factor
MPRHVPAVPPQGLDVRAALRPPLLHVQLSGDLDFLSAAQLGAADAVRAEEPRVRAVLLDLARLAFCDATGARALVEYVEAQTRLRREVAARNAPPPVLAALRALGMGHLVLG